MDPALIRESKAFKRKLVTNPVVENKKKKESTEDESRKKPKAAPKPTPQPPRVDASNYKPMTGSFAILTKIVKHLEMLHQKGKHEPLTLEQILDDTNQLDVSPKISGWLRSEALAYNRKIDVTLDGCYVFKPPFEIRDEESLLKLLRQTDLKGLCGILLEDIQESLPNHEQILKDVDKDIVYITRLDKKEIFFYNDKAVNMDIDDEFQKLWRTTPEDESDYNKIGEHSKKEGIRSMQDTILKVMPKLKLKAVAKKRVSKKARDNEHLKDVLEKYD